MFEIFLGLDQCKNSQFTFHWGFSSQAAWLRLAALAGRGRGQRAGRPGHPGCAHPLPLAPRGEAPQPGPEQKPGARQCIFGSLYSVLLCIIGNPSHVL